MAKEESVQKMIWFSSTESKKEIESFLMLVYQVTGKSMSNIIEEILRDAIFTNSFIRGQFIKRILKDEDLFTNILADLFLFVSTLKREANYLTIRELCFLTRRIYIKSNKELPILLEVMMFSKEDDDIPQEAYRTIAETLRHDLELSVSDKIRLDAIRIIRNLSYI